MDTKCKLRSEIKGTGVRVNQRKYQNTRLEKPIPNNSLRETIQADIYRSTSLSYRQPRKQERSLQLDKCSPEREDKFPILSFTYANDLDKIARAGINLENLNFKHLLSIASKTALIATPTGCSTAEFSTEFEHR